MCFGIQDGCEKYKDKAAWQKVYKTKINILGNFQQHCFGKTLMIQNNLIQDCDTPY